MPEPLHTLLRMLHVGGGWLAFGIAPVALLAPKGGRRHILAGRCFVIAMGSGITAGLILAMVDGAIGLLLFGLVTTFFLGTGYLAPRIGRGSHGSYRLDRILPVVGALASLGLVFDGWEKGTGLVLDRKSGGEG